MKILVLSLDYDDCLVRKLDSKEQPRAGEEGFDAISTNEFDEVVNRHNPPKNKIKWKKRLTSDNEQMLKYVSSIAVRYDEIIICCGSNRQNPYVDTTNSCRSSLYSGSCYEGLEIFRETLKERLSVPVILDRTVTADFFHKRQQGKTFLRTVAWLRGESKEEKDFFDECPNDRTKVSLHYMYMHKLAGERPGAEIDYYAIDDSYQAELKLPNPAIIDALNDVYPKNPDIIPAKTTLFTLPYQHGTLDAKKITQVKGSGIVDSGYDETMLQMMCCSMEGNDYEQRKNRLLEYNYCSCWDVFSDPQKMKIFRPALENRTCLTAQSPIDDFITRHRLSYNGGCFCGFFSRTNLNKYEALTGEAILTHAKQTTFLGFKNRTRTILEEMGIVNNDGDLLKPEFKRSSPASVDT